MKEPKHYKGREHSYIKHRLLETYLETLFMIIGQHKQRICYVDCFSGPWQESSENLSDTSIALSLNVMRKCRNSLRSKLNKKVDFRALFIEKDKQAYQKLTAFLTNNPLEGIKTTSLNGEFHELRNAILHWCGNTDFVFFFIDPKGWKNAIEIPTLTPLLKRPNSEYLINFMYDFLVRTHTQKEFQAHMRLIFGEVPNTSGLTPKEREDYLIKRYRESLKSIQPSGAGKLRSAYVSIRDPVKERTKYHLVYLTHHHLGLVKFMDASEKMDIVQKKVRASTKQQRRIESTGQHELFPAEIDTDAYDETVDIEVVKDYWLEKLSSSPIQYSNEDLADMLEETCWFESNLQQSFNELIDEGKVNNLDAKNKRPKKPVHFDKNERLQRVEQ